MTNEKASRRNVYRIHEDGDRRRQLRCKLIKNIPVFAHSAGQSRSNFVPDKIVNREGYTLIELLIVLAILSLSVGFLIPSFGSLKKQHLADAEMKQLYRAVELARMIAVKTHHFIILCPIQNNKNWGREYVITDNKNKANVIIKIFKTADQNGKLYFKGFPSRNFLRFSPLGTTDHQNGTFYYCPQNADSHYARALFINQSVNSHLKLTPYSHLKLPPCH